ncbi:MAG TPA: glycoside hydrolase family 130 protein [Acidimicrobiia bacterium]|nr:glycoside hydrolase family 130 protein [Acidimicrobiia bacterium]
MARPFLPGMANFGGEPSRLDTIVKRVLEIPEEEYDRLLDELVTRHRALSEDLDAIWLRHFEGARELSPVLADVSEPRLQKLVGAFLTQAYAYEGAALTNPSIVPLGDPSEGRQPFVMSMRAIGEGHISSIAFATGVVDGNGEIELDERHPYVSNGERHAPQYVRSAFAAKLDELGFMNQATQGILAILPAEFSAYQLDVALARIREADLTLIEVEDSIHRVHWLAASNYEVAFDETLPVSEHLISPAAPAESRGMEDARFVRFTHDDGRVTNYATYTAYDGTHILPQLIETADFHNFRMATMTGPAIYHKGMALFPRRVDGEFLALSRHDHERLFLLRSDDVRTWTNAEMVIAPEHVWETVHIGNCGSPIETEAGWLVITHGVGPMRRYSLGAVLLDLHDPSQLIGRLPTPLVEPSEDEMFGYVPNVVYSCGSMTHAGRLIVPYGFADRAIGFAVVDLAELIDEMR